MCLKKQLSETALSCPRASAQSCYGSTSNHTRQSLVLVRVSLPQLFALKVLVCSSCLLLPVVCVV